MVLLVYIYIYIYIYRTRSMCKRQVGFVIFSFKLLFLLATGSSCPDSGGVSEVTADSLVQGGPVKAQGLPNV